MIFVLIMTFGIIAGIEVPKLLRQKYWRELTVFAILLSVGFILSLLLVMGVNIPPITETIADLLGSLLNIASN